MTNRTETWISALFFILVLIFSIAYTTHCFGTEIRTPEDDRVACALSIARLYGLSREQVVLLLAIRAHENARPGKEFGIEYPPCKFRDGKRSFVDNCARCCEIIKGHCPVVNFKSVKKLNSFYAEDRDWHRGVWKARRKYLNILY